MIRSKVLIVDDDPDVLTAAYLLLKYDYEVETLGNPDDLPQYINKTTYDVILLDMNFTRDATSGEEGFHWLDKIKQNDENVVVILITAYGDVSLAVEAVKAGAFNFILKPWQNEKILATVSAAIRYRKTKIEKQVLASQSRQLSDDADLPFHDMIGKSPVMKQVFQMIRKVAATDANVLILGENGTGKELVARAIHRQSHRKNRIFMSVDMGAIPETLFESELFGHQKGAFTDARQDKPGRFILASGGTLFLDEIGNLALPLQAKLLRVLEDREIMPLGSTKMSPFDARLICATNRPVYSLSSENIFRQDLLYRINTVEIPLPPLRERHDDIAQLAQHFLKRLSQKYNRSMKKIHSDVINQFLEYSWPGNVRELRHVIERAVILGEGHMLMPDHVMVSVNQTSQIKDDDDMKLSVMERLTIQKALTQCQGNVTKTANMLGLTRTSLYRRLEKYGFK